MILNLSIFMWFGAVCPWYQFAHNSVIPVYRLIFLGVLILLLRRIPIVYLLHKHIWQVEKKRQALFVGFFGPIGVSSVFYLYISLEFLGEVTLDGATREDAARLEEIMTVVVWFLGICSIVRTSHPQISMIVITDNKIQIVHGLSVPLGKLGYNLPRTLSTRVSNALDRQEPFQVQSPVLDGDEVHRQSRFRELDSRRRNDPSRPIFRIGGSLIHEGKSDDETPKEAMTKDATSLELPANPEETTGASPAAAHFHDGQDPEKGEPITDGKV